MASLLGKHKISVETGSLADGDSIAAYLTDAAGALLTSTLVGAKQRLDAIDVASHLDGAAYAAGTDYLSSLGAVDNSGNWKPLNLDASGNLKTSAAVTFTAEHNQDSASASGDSLIGVAMVRQDTLATDTTASGNYSFFKSTALGELYVHDTDVKAQLVSANSTLTNIKSDTASIVTNTGTTASNTGTIATNTGNTASNTSTIASTLSALSHADGSSWASGNQGIEALAVRKDASGASSGVTDGTYSPLQTWSEGSLKVVDIANGSILQQQIAVTNSATQLPASALANRRSMLIQNAGSASIWVGSSTVTASGATTGIEVPKGGFIELEVGPAVDVYAISAGTVNANILQMA